MPQVVFLCPVVLHKHHLKKKLLSLSLKQYPHQGILQVKAWGNMKSKMDLQEGLSSMRHKKFLDS